MGGDGLAARRYYSAARVFVVGQPHLPSHLPAHHRRIRPAAPDP